MPRTISQGNCLPKALVDNETVDAFKHDLRDPNLSSFWHWPRQRLYSKRSFC